MGSELAAIFARRRFADDDAAAAVTDARPESDAIKTAGSSATADSSVMSSASSLSPVALPPELQLCGSSTGEGLSGVGSDVAEAADAAKVVGLVDASGLIAGASPQRGQLQNRNADFASWIRPAASPLVVGSDESEVPKREAVAEAATAPVALMKCSESQLLVQLPSSAPKKIGNDAASWIKRIALSGEDVEGNVSHKEVTDTAFLPSHGKPPTQRAPLPQKVVLRNDGKNAASWKKQTVASSSAGKGNGSKVLKTGMTDALEDVAIATDAQPPLTSIRPSQSLNAGKNAASWIKREAVHLPENENDTNDSNKAVREKCPPPLMSLMDHKTSPKIESTQHRPFLSSKVMNTSSWIREPAHSTDNKKDITRNSNTEMVEKEATVASSPPRLMPLAKKGKFSASWIRHSPEDNNFSRDSNTDTADSKAEVLKVEQKKKIPELKATPLSPGLMPLTKKGKNTSSLISNIDGHSTTETEDAEAAVLEVKLQPQPVLLPSRLPQAKKKGKSAASWIRHSPDEESNVVGSSNTKTANTEAVVPEGLPGETKPEPQTALLFPVPSPSTKTGKSAASWIKKTAYSTEKENTVGGHADTEIAEADAADVEVVARETMTPPRLLPVPLPSKKMDSVASWMRGAMHSSGKKNSAAEAEAAQEVPRETPTSPLAALLQVPKPSKEGHNAASCIRKEAFSPEEESNAGGNADTGKESAGGYAETETAEAEVAEDEVVPRETLLSPQAVSVSSPSKKGKIATSWIRTELHYPQKKNNAGGYAETETTETEAATLEEVRRRKMLPPLAASLFPTQMQSKEGKKASSWIRKGAAHSPEEETNVYVSADTGITEMTVTTPVVTPRSTAQLRQEASLQLKPMSSKKGINASSWIRGAPHSAEEERNAGGNVDTDIVQAELSPLPKVSPRETMPPQQEASLPLILVPSKKIGKKASSWIKGPSAHSPEEENDGDGSADTEIVGVESVAPAGARTEITPQTQEASVPLILTPSKKGKDATSWIRRVAVSSPEEENRADSNSNTDNVKAKAAAVEATSTETKLQPQAALSPRMQVSSRKNGNDDASWIRRAVRSQEQEDSAGGHSEAKRADESLNVTVVPIESNQLSKNKTSLPGYLPSKKVVNKTSSSGNRKVPLRGYEEEEDTNSKRIPLSGVALNETLKLPPQENDLPQHRAQSTRTKNEAQSWIQKMKASSPETEDANTTKVAAHDAETSNMLLSTKLKADRSMPLLATEKVHSEGESLLEVAKGCKGEALPIDCPSTEEHDLKQLSMKVHVKPWQASSSDMRSIDVPPWIQRDSIDDEGKCSAKASMAADAAEDIAALQDCRKGNGRDEVSTPTKMIPATVSCQEKGLGDASSHGNQARGKISSRITSFLADSRQRLECDEITAPVSPVLAEEENCLSESLEDSSPVTLQHELTDKNEDNGKGAATLLLADAREGFRSTTGKSDGFTATTPTASSREHHLAQKMPSVFSQNSGADDTRWTGTNPAASPLPTGDLSAASMSHCSSRADFPSVHSGETPRVGIRPLHPVVPPLYDFGCGSIEDELLQPKRHSSTGASKDHLETPLKVYAGEGSTEVLGGIQHAQVPFGRGTAKETAATKNTERCLDDSNTDNTIEDAIENKTEKTLEIYVCSTEKVNMHQSEEPAPITTISVGRIECNKLDRKWTFSPSLRSDVTEDKGIGAANVADTFDAVDLPSADDSLMALSCMAAGKVGSLSNVAIPEHARDPSAAIDRSADKDFKPEKLDTVAPFEADECSGNISAPSGEGTAATPLLMVVDGGGQSRVKKTTADTSDPSQSMSKDPPLKHRLSERARDLAKDRAGRKNFTSKRGSDTGILRPSSSNLSIAAVSYKGDSMSVLKSSSVDSNRNKASSTVSPRGRLDIYSSMRLSKSRKLGLFRKPSCGVGRDRLNREAETSSSHYEKVPLTITCDIPSDTCSAEKGKQVPQINLKSRRVLRDMIKTTRDDKGDLSSPSNSLTPVAPVPTAASFAPSSDAHRNGMKIKKCSMSSTKKYSMISPKAPVIDRAEDTSGTPRVSNELLHQAKEHLHPSPMKNCCGADGGKDPSNIGETTEGGRTSKEILNAARLKKSSNFKDGPPQSLPVASARRNGRNNKKHVVDRADLSSKGTAVTTHGNNELFHQARQHLQPSVKKIEFGTGIDGKDSSKNRETKAGERTPQGFLDFARLKKNTDVEFATPDAPPVTSVRMNGGNVKRCAADSSPSEDTAFNPHVSDELFRKVRQDLRSTPKHSNCVTGGGRDHSKKKGTTAGENATEGCSDAAILKKNINVHHARPEAPPGNSVRILGGNGKESCKGKSNTSQSKRPATESTEGKTRTKEGPQLTRKDVPLATIVSPSRLPPRCNSLHQVSLQKLPNPDGKKAASALRQRKHYSQKSVAAKETASFGAVGHHVRSLSAASIDSITCEIRQRDSLPSSVPLNSPIEAIGPSAGSDNDLTKEDRKKTELKIKNDKKPDAGCSKAAVGLNKDDNLLGNTSQNVAHSAQAATETSFILAQPNIAYAVAKSLSTSTVGASRSAVAGSSPHKANGVALPHCSMPSSFSSPGGAFSSIAVATAPDCRSAFSHTKVPYTSPGVLGAGFAGSAFLPRPGLIPSTSPLESLGSGSSSSRRQDKHGVSPGLLLPAFSGHSGKGDMSPQHQDDIHLPNKHIHGVQGHLNETDGIIESVRSSTYEFGSEVEEKDKQPGNESLRKASTEKEIGQSRGQVVARDIQLHMHKFPEARHQSSGSDRQFLC